MAFTPDELQDCGDWYNHSVLARLKPGVTFNQAQADAALVTAEVKRVYPPAMVKPASLTSAVVAQIHSLDPQLPVANIHTMDQEMTSSVAAPKFNTFVLGVFAFLALFLAAIGIYGVLAYAVAQQTHEIGIRMALGAQWRDVMRLILVQGARLALVGIAIGLLAAFSLTRLMPSLLYDISASDPLTFAAVAIVLLAVALAACYIPARRFIHVFLNKLMSDAVRPDLERGHNHLAQSGHARSQVFARPTS
jgi:ABC-type antimicrobial peptide transport system permease subunit